jgi:hypothetical protein
MIQSIQILERHFAAHHPHHRANLLGISQFGLLACHRLMLDLNSQTPSETIAISLLLLSLIKYTKIALLIFTQAKYRSTGLLGRLS